MTNAEKFCKLNGIEWNAHEACPHCGYYCTGKTVFCTPPIANPTFKDAKSILEVMIQRPREDYIGFMKSLYGEYEPDMIHLDYVFDSKRLLNKAIDWCEKGESK